MIRINLLSEGRRPTVARQPKVRSGGAADRASLALLCLFVVALLVALGHNFLLGRTLGDTKTEVADAQREVDELAPIIKEVEEFKAKRSELERKVTVIGDLKERQHGPVQIMDHVSRAIPELLWMQKMEVRPTKILLTGQAFNTNAVANFIENLDLVEAFREPVLKDTSKDGDIYKYVIEFTYSFGSHSDGDALGETLSS